jgi:ribose-phosphate pyrophosphokinase
MTAPLLIPLIGEDRRAQALAQLLGAELGRVQIRHFPDGEVYLRHETTLERRSVILLCSLERPDSKVLPLIFAADAARELGARSIGLVAPYLAYMRQDRRFSPGEAITSAHFAQLLSKHVDWLVTVDPHLHRYTSLSEIYDIPTAVAHAAPLISEWIAREVERPLLIGPDIESEQWVTAVAQDAGAPSIVLRKHRRGDREVEIETPDLAAWQDRTPVLVDDIVSTARTMIVTIGHLRKAGMRAPVCLAVHGLFAGNAFQELLTAGAARVATCNTIAHDSNAIDVTPNLAKGVRQLTGGTGEAA